MDFWLAQRRARNKTTIYVTLFIFLTLVVAILLEAAMRYFAEDSYTVGQFPLIGLIFALITFGVAGFQYVNFQLQGGGAVAQSLGAHLVSSDTRNLKEIQLRNIVQEIAVASSLPVPPIYVLDANQINAFAAGLTPQDAAITVTKGTLNSLNRDELQGVVAHEFGHIYNGDMKISMRLAAMVMGFFCILYLGFKLFQLMARGRDDRKGNPILLVALLFTIAGTFTWLMGSILKSAVSREREYLADACAVQFTRNPDGISNALRKIAASEVKDMPMHGTAYSHLYLDDRSYFSWLFRTHPPIEKRIEAIEGREYIPDEWEVQKDKNDKKDINDI